MIFLPVSPASPSGPPITNLPVGLTCQIVFSVIQPSGKVSKTYGEIISFISSEDNFSSKCWVDKTIDLTFLGIPSM